MRLWQIRPRTVLRVTLVLFTTVIPLLAFPLASTRFVFWIRTQVGSQYYVEQSYLGDAAFWLCVGMMGVLPAGWVLFRPQARLWWLGLPVLVSLFMIWYPYAKDSIYHPLGISPSPGILAARYVQQQLGQVRGEIQSAADSGMSWRCLSGTMPTQSLYSHRGAALFYQRVCVDADQPMDLLLSSSPPGTIFIATTPGEPTVRLFATVLPQEMSDTASWLQSSFGRPGSFVLSLSASGTVRHLSPTSAPRGRTEYP